MCSRRTDVARGVHASPPQIVCTFIVLVAAEGYAAQLPPTVDRAASEAHGKLVRPTEAFPAARHTLRAYSATSAGCEQRRPTHRMVSQSTAE